MLNLKVNIIIGMSYRVTIEKGRGMKQPWKIRGIWFLLIAMMAAVCAAGGQSKEKGEDETGGYKVVNVYPHDANAFTQGLFYRDGFLYESTGLHGKSSLRKVEFKTGKVIRRTDLAKEYFGEGTAILKGRIYQLTWRERTGFIYDVNDFRVVGRFRYKQEGWGLTTDGKRLIMSDGTDNLYFLEPETMQIARKIKVRDNDGEVKWLNELEYVRGQIYANVLMKDEILKISPETGEVTGRIDLRELMKNERPRNKNGVLNGIAYDAEGDRLFVTGKMWPKLFEIRELTGREKKD